MKTSSKRGARREEGSAFLISMILIIIVLPLAISYLLASQQQYKAVDHSQGWSKALPVAEAGIEEAFAHLNAECYSNALNMGATNWLNGGFLSDGTNLTLPNSRYLGVSNKTVAYYVLRIITNSSDGSLSRSSPDIVSIGYAPSSSSQSNYIARQVRVHTTINFTYTHGLESSNCIQFNGNGRELSFDSSDAMHSFLGTWDPRYMLPSNASIASIVGCIDLGSHGAIYGPAYTSPYGTGLSGGSIGDSNWITSGVGGYQPGYNHNDYNPSNLNDPTNPSDKDSWTPLNVWNGLVTYTNSAITNAFMSSSTYPVNPPVVGLVTSTIRTNTSGLVPWSTNRPTGIADADIITNWLSYSSATYPTNPTPAVVWTNASSTVITTTANTVSNAAPSATPPTYGNYAIPPGITTNYLVVSNFYATAPPSSAYLTYCNILLDKNGHNIEQNHSGVKWPLYQYDWIVNYTYNTISGYSWSNAVYSYVTNVYTYTAARLSNEVMTTTAYYAVPYPTTPNVSTWKIDSVSLSGSKTFLITKPNQQIYVSGDFKMAGQAQIQLAEGASVTFYFGGDVDIAGQGVANSPPNTALNLQMIGLPTCPSIKVSGNGQAMAVINAPHSNITLNGNGTVIGAIIGNNVTVNGNPDIIFDNALKKNGPSDGFIATKWIEELVGTGP